MIESVLKTLTLATELYRASEIEKADHALRQAMAEYRATSGQCRRETVTEINRQKARLKTMRDAILASLAALPDSQRTQIRRVVEETLAATLDAELRVLEAEKRRQSRG